jgi:hypothetical protein
VLFAQRRDLSGQRPDETDAVRRRAGNEVVVLTVRHSEYGCMLPIHALKVPFLPSNINLIPASNGTDQARAIASRPKPASIHPAWTWTYGGDLPSPKATARREVPCARFYGIDVNGYYQKYEPKASQRSRESGGVSATGSLDKAREETCNPCLYGNIFFLTG